MDDECGRGAKSFASAEERKASLVSYGCSVKLKDVGPDGSRSGVKLKEQQEVDTFYQGWNDQNAKTLLAFCTPDSTQAVVTSSSFLMQKKRRALAYYLHLEGVEDRARHQQPKPSAGLALPTLQP